MIQIFKLKKQRRGLWGDEQIGAESQKSCAQALHRFVEHIRGTSTIIFCIMVNELHAFRYRGIAHWELHQRKPKGQGEHVPLGSSAR